MKADGDISDRHLYCHQNGENTMASKAGKEVANIVTAAAPFFLAWRGNEKTGGAPRA